MSQCNINVMRNLTPCLETTCWQVKSHFLTPLRPHSWASSWESLRAPSFGTTRKFNPCKSCSLANSPDSHSYPLALSQAISDLPGSCLLCPPCRSQYVSLFMFASDAIGLNIPTIGMWLPPNFSGYLCNKRHSLMYLPMCIYDLNINSMRETILYVSLTVPRMQSIAHRKSFHHLGWCERQRKVFHSWYTRYSRMKTLTVHWFLLW